MEAVNGPGEILKNTGESGMVQRGYTGIAAEQVPMQCQHQNDDFLDVERGDDTSNPSKKRIR